MPHFRDTKYKIFYIFLKKPLARILSLTISYMMFDYNGCTVGISGPLLENW